MATSTESIKSDYPLPAYNYRVTVLKSTVQSLPAGTAIAQAIGAATVISCSEVSGLSMELDTVTYKHGLSFIMGSHIIPAQRKEVNLVMKKGLTAQGKFFADWIDMVYPIIIPIGSKLFGKRDILIDLCDEKGEPVVRWTVMKALPTKLEAPTFDAHSNEVAFQSLHLIASQLRVEYLK